MTQLIDEADRSLRRESLDKPFPVLLGVSECGHVVDRRCIRLAPLGRAVLPRARAALADADLVEQTARQVTTHGAGELVVATINSLSLGALPGVLRAWRAEHPDVGVRLHVHNDMTTLLEAFAQRQADLAVTPLPGDWTGERWLVGEEPFVVAVGAEHTLTGRDRATLTEFAEANWVHFPAHHYLRSVLDNLVALAGFEPLVAIRTGQTAAAPPYAAAGVGVALVPVNILGPGTAMWRSPRPADDPADPRHLPRARRCADRSIHRRREGLSRPGPGLGSARPGLE